MSESVELPLHAPYLVRHTVNCLHGQAPLMQLAVLAAAAAWIVVARFPAAQRAPLLIRLAQRLASQAALCEAQTRGGAG